MLADLLRRSRGRSVDLADEAPESLTWAVHVPFWEYVKEASGHILVSPPAQRKDREVVFPYAETRTVQGTLSLRFEGQVTFTAHGGALDLRLAAPRIDLTDTAIWLSAVCGNDHDARRLPVAELRTRPQGHDQLDTFLTPAGVDLFGGQYPVGMPLSTPYLRRRS